MKNKSAFVSICSLFLFFNVSHAQYALKDAFQLGYPDTTRGRQIITSQNGNIYTVGRVAAGADLDPGPDTFKVSAGGYFCKLSSDKDFQWAKTIAGGTPSILALGRNDDIIAEVDIGIDSADLDPGPGTFYIESATGLMSLDSNGNFKWATRLIAVIAAIVTDKTGNIYVTGSFPDAFDFDPGPGEEILDSHGGVNGFILKLDANGKFLWAKQIASIYSTCESMSIDPLGNIFVTGFFSIEADLDPGTMEYKVTAVNSNEPDYFTIKLDNAGDFLWGITWEGNTSGNNNFSAAPDGKSLFLTGSFQKTMRFNTPQGQDSLIAEGTYQNVFILKMDASDGTFIWANKLVKNTNTVCTGMAVNDQNNLCVTGHFADSIVFDDGTKRTKLTAISSSSKFQSDIFILVTDSSGENVWFKGIGSANTSNGGGIIFDKSDILTTGYYTGDTDFDPGYDTFMLTTKNANAYIARFSPCIPTHTSISVTACDSFTAPDGEVYHSSGKYTATLADEGRCDSIITIDLTILRSTHSVISVKSCQPYTAPDGKVYIKDGVHSAIITNSLGCDSVITINLTMYEAKSTVTISACDSFIAPDGKVYKQSGNYTAVIPSNEGCDSTITIKLTVNKSRNVKVKATACESYTAPDGKVYTQSGTYTAALKSPQGCDSTLVIDLVINKNSSSSISPVACDAYTAPDGKVYTKDGNYSAIVPNAKGCDSTITINLTITQPDTVVTLSADTLTASATGAQYKWLDCNDNYAAVPGETSQRFVPLKSGMYAAEITISGCVDTSSCHTVRASGVVEYGMEAFYCIIFPNPSRGKLTVEVSGASQMIIYDLVGKEVYRAKVTATSVHDISFLPDGSYSVNISGEEGSVTRQLIITR